MHTQDTWVSAEEEKGSGSHVLRCIRLIAFSIVQHTTTHFCLIRAYIRASWGVDGRGGEGKLTPSSQYVDTRPPHLLASHLLQHVLLHDQNGVKELLPLGMVWRVFCYPAPPLLLLILCQLVEERERGERRERAEEGRGREREGEQRKEKGRGERAEGGREREEEGERSVHSK